MLKVSIELSNAVIRTSLGKDSDKWTVVDIGKMPPAVLKAALLNEFISALNDISRGKDENGKPLTDEQWAKKRAQRVATWYGGAWASAERGDQHYTVLREQYIAEQVALGNTVKSVEAGIKQLVQSTFGEGEAATFSRFLDAVATHLVKDDGGDFATTREEIETDLAARAEAARAERAKATEKVDVKGIALAAFKRPA